MRSVSRKPASERAGNSYDREIRGNLETSQVSGARHSKSRRTATLYDAVAGRVGLNGFLTVNQLESGQIRPSAPEEVLLRRVDAPDEIPYDYYNGDERLDPSHELPDSELLKDVHIYVADYYERVCGNDEMIDFRSLDETALLAMGILLEEACREALGRDGDMVFSEPAHRDRQMPRDQLSRHQVIGTVVPPRVSEYQSLSDEDVGQTEMQPRKRQRRRYWSHDDT